MTRGVQPGEQDLRGHLLEVLRPTGVGGAEHDQGRHRGDAVAAGVGQLREPGVSAQSRLHGAGGRSGKAPLSGRRQSPCQGQVVVQGRHGALSLAHPGHARFVQVPLPDVALAVDLEPVRGRQAGRRALRGQGPQLDELAALLGRCGHRGDLAEGERREGGVIAVGVRQRPPGEGLVRPCPHLRELAHPGLDLLLTEQRRGWVGSDGVGVPGGQDGGRDRRGHQRRHRQRELHPDLRARGRPA